jgi:hypothetical protein
MVVGKLAGITMREGSEACLKAQPSKTLVIYTKLVSSKSCKITLRWTVQARNGLSGRK